MTCRVLLAHDHQMVLEGIRALLNAQPNIEVVALARNGRDAIRLAHETHPNVVILDVLMRGMNGVDATRQIKAECAGVEVLCLSGRHGSEQVSAMLRAGAVGYLLKEDASDELIQAIRVVAGGESYLSPRVATSVVEMVRGSNPPAVNSPFSILTDREREVLQLLAEGYSSRAIAECLHLSVRTVSSHRESVKLKLGIRSTAGLTRYAIQNGLTPLD